MSSEPNRATVLRKRIHIQGIVQGVGFRPFVYELAVANQLGGWVRNSSEGVFIEVEGPADRLESFEGDLKSPRPVLAQIDSIQITDIPQQGTRDFVILDSAYVTGEFVLVPPDIATCGDCYKDFIDPANRRYRYPFTNCTNCGPRYTIIRDIPYDRPTTTMVEFPMCPDCRAEYENPADRRFHAQPNACPVCGPALSAPIEKAQSWLREGKVVAIKGLGGFHLACDATNGDAVHRLRGRKRRSDKPFAIMAPDLAAVERCCVVNPADREALESPRRPIVILPRRPGTAISEAVAPGNKTIGVMLPYTPLHHLLFQGDGRRFEALVMTSGNVSEEPIVSQEEELPRLASLYDEVLAHNRKIQTRVDDSVVRTFEGQVRAVRRSRGYAPQPVRLAFEMAPALGAGGELKNTFCLTKQTYAILSQHIGDLENLETLGFFHETLAHMKRFYRIEPEVVGYDLHPGYLSTRAALEMRDVRKVGVQHHHAHIASCMAENGLREKVIGVSFDGTGYGTDGQIWGGEFLVCDFLGFERCGHLRYVPLAGGDAAVREPWRMALSYAQDVFGQNLPEQLFHRIEPRRRAIVEAMLARRVNTVLTSSCGRLFDAVASLIGVRDEANYEGQAAIELEAVAEDGVETRYGFELNGVEVDLRPAIAEIVADLQNGKEAGKIAASFHNTVVAVIVEACRRMRASHGLEKVCLSGGTFQNFYLLRRAVDGLRQAGFAVYLHSQVPANDGGIALGQAVIAAEAARR
jgi:hydrogenase maturation protein HypF